MSLIKTHLHDIQKQKEALEEAKLLLLEYTMFGSLSPMQNMANEDALAPARMLDEWNNSFELYESSSRSGYDYLYEGALGDFPDE